MALPPPKPPVKPGLVAPPTKEDALARSRREKDELESEVKSVEEETEALKARYDQYFLGIERREPNRWRDELKKKVLRLKAAFTRNTGLRFRIESLHARFLSYERLWLRGAREKEEGTYRRDVYKARLRSGAAAGADAPATKAAANKDAATKAPSAAAAATPAGAATNGPVPAAAATPDPAAAPPASPSQAGPAAGPKPPPLPRAAAASSAPPAAGGAMNETQMRALYNAYLAAKMTCREDVSKLSYEAVARTVSKQIPELMTRYKAKSVDFKVEVRDGRAILKAIPKV